jgi:hypothetical protein
LSTPFEVVIGNYPSPPLYPPAHISSTSSAISFSWEPYLDSGGGIVSSYKIYMNGVSIDTVSSSVLSYTVSTGLTSGSTYQFAISSVSNIGEGDLGFSSTFYAIDTPSAPVISVDTSSRDSCSVSWAQVAAPLNSVITGYVIEIDDGL